MNIRQLKLIRLFLGMTQVEFAEHIEVAPSTVAKIEAGFIAVSDVTRSRVLRKFDISAPEFIAFSERMSA